MDSKTYMAEALKTVNNASNIDITEKQKYLINGVIGLGGEVGELQDLLKKHVFQGHQLDIEHVKYEIGDIAWYLNLLIASIGSNWEEVFEINVQKLRKRYGEKFDSLKSINRTDNM